MNPDLLTWTGLLARWMDFARASLALPDDAEGDAWRACVAPIITLQAVTFALGDLENLPADEHAVARDKSAILIDESLDAINDAWGAGDAPGPILDILGDARQALETSVWIGTRELRWPGPGTMVMPAVEIGEARGSLAVMQPGTIVMPGEPVAWWLARPAIEIDGCIEHAVSAPRQVYRQVDSQGRIDGDLIAPLADILPPGFPLLVPLFDEGRPIGHFTLDPDDWHARQREAMGDDEIGVREV